MDALIKRPGDVLQDMLRAGTKKNNTDFTSLILKAIFAGMFISLSAASSSAAIYGIENTGLAKTLAGVIFPVGLMMVIMLGGELFTGNCLIFFSRMNGESSTADVTRILFLVYIGNLIGAVFIAFMVFGSGQFDYSGGMLGAFTIKVAVTKATANPVRLFISANLCNILVCLSVLMANACKDVVGKMLAAFFPILAFVVGGYEHCVANMYYIPAGILAATNEKYRQIAMDSYGITLEQLQSLNLKTFFIDNLVPVTLGNIVGGVVLIAIPFYIIYRKKEEALV